VIYAVSLRARPGSRRRGGGWGQHRPFVGMLLRPIAERSHEERRASPARSTPPAVDTVQTGVHAVDQRPSTGGGRRPLPLFQISQALHAAHGCRQTSRVVPDPTFIPLLTGDIPARVDDLSTHRVLLADRRRPTRVCQKRRWNGPGLFLARKRDYRTRVLVARAICVPLTWVVERVSRVVLDDGLWTRGRARSTVTAPPLPSYRHAWPGHARCATRECAPMNALHHWIRMGGDHLVSGSSVTQSKAANEAHDPVTIPTESDMLLRGMRHAAAPHHDAGLIVVSRFVFLSGPRRMRKTLAAD